MRKYESGDKQDLLKMQLHLLSFSFPWRTMLKFLSLYDYMEILAECDTSPKQQLESWVKYQSKCTVGTFLSPSEAPAMKDASPLVNLLRVCYLEEHWECKGAAWDCHIHWWTCRYIHPEGTCFLQPFMNERICHTLAYPCILTLSSFVCAFASGALMWFLTSPIKQVAICMRKGIERLSGESPSRHLKFEWLNSFIFIFRVLFHCLPAYNLFIRKLWSIHKS